MWLTVIIVLKAVVFTATNKVSRDFYIQSCGNVVVLESYDSASVIWDPSASHCSLIVQPHPHRVKVTLVGDFSQLCSVDRVRWLCAASCTTLQYTTNEIGVGQLWESKTSRYFEKTYLKFLYCGTRRLRLYLSTEKVQPPASPGIALTVVLPTIAACVLAILITLAVLAIIRRQQLAAVLRRRCPCYVLQQQGVSEDRPPTYQDYHKYSKPTTHLSRTRSSVSSAGLPDYNEALGIIRNGQAQVLLSASDLLHEESYRGVPGGGCVNPAFVPDMLPQ